MKSLLIKSLIFLCITNATDGSFWSSGVVKNIIGGVMKKYFAKCVYVIQFSHNQGECWSDILVTICFYISNGKT